MAITKKDNCAEGQMNLKDLLWSAAVTKNSDGVPGLRLILRAQAESGLTPMAQCAGRPAPATVDDVLKELFALTTDGKIALVLYEAESTTTP